MKNVITIFTYIIFAANLSYAQVSRSSVKYLDHSFVHPGMLQNKQDIEFIKQKILAGEQPWKKAFEDLKKETPLDFKPAPFPHVSVGPYGLNNNGGQQFAENGKMAYNNALIWAASGEKAYAEKSVEILNAWSSVLWDFDENNAKLNVGLNGPLYLNAAEILKHTNSGWKEKDMEQFERMVMTVFYPTIKDFFTEANGNWDASIINTILCIGVFTDDREIFNRAVERFYHGPWNSGITKYIYPNGQIQETTRDWEHVQLGIGEFAKAAQVAWTQGLDFYRAADDRLALGFEYTARFLLGDNNIPVYGVLSVKEREKFRDIYESVYHHYHFCKGIEMPYTADMISKKNSASLSYLLTALRAPGGTAPQTFTPLSFSAAIPSVFSLVGAPLVTTARPPKGSVTVSPGSSVQAAIDANAGKGTWVILAKGVHTLSESLKIPSGTTLAGQGKESVLFLGPGKEGTFIVNSDNDMHDVTIRDLLIEGANTVVTNFDPNTDRRLRSYMNATSREGIEFSAGRHGQMRNIHFESLTVQNCTKNGVAVRGATNVVVNNCDFSDNGSSVVPGAGFHHNLLLTRISDCRVSNSRFDTSPWGSGVDLSFVNKGVISKNEAARNRLSGIRCTESRNIEVTENLVEGNDGSGILFDALMDGSQNIEISDNISQYNNEHGILLDKVSVSKVMNNKTLDNGQDR